MRSLIRSVQIIIGVLVLLSAPVVKAGTPVEFSWAVLSDTATGLRPLDFSTVPQLQNGTTLQIYIEQNPGTFIYLYLIDSTGDLSFIFPGDPEHYELTFPENEVVRIPPETARFELTQPNGQEKMYLLASSTRLVELETLTAAYLQDESSPAARAEVLRELKLLHRKHSSLSQRTETSVPVAGTIRTRGAAESTFDAIHVKADRLYSRILRLNHE